ncbi:glutamate receptor 2.7-like isoform X3 [Prosopis cineraria]|uniref:glutamate receptor 2.7-like isoform X3 n=1 Tax=Prosopis cineraria TaxID=364024 RepID=UPI00240F1AFA|nr:glutamate receptor 2.7-like isoform X3 [Prosopis cineraria]
MIVANRSNFVDFTLPYAQYDVRILVKLRNDPRLNMWIFEWPFSWDIWLCIVVVCIFTGGIILFMEHNVQEDSTIENSPIRKQLSGVSILWLPIMQAVFLERELLARNCSSLTVDSSRVKEYPGIKQYKEALDKGSQRGGVNAIFDEVPYIKVFLAKYGSNYAMVGPRHRTAGFGFAFRKDSTITSYFSQAILNISQSKEMDYIEDRYFNTRDDDGISSSLSSNDDSSSLTAYSFAGLFVVFGILSLLALLISEHRFWRRHVMLMKMYSKKFLSRSSTRTNNMSEEGSRTRRNDEDGEGSMNRENIGSGDGEYKHEKKLVASIP